MSLSLIMIVKNEASIIRKTLENILQHFAISHYCIVDTGSSDDTPAIIKEFFESHTVPGMLHHSKFVDFATNRTESLHKAFNMTDWGLIFDADDYVIDGEEDLNPAKGLPLDSSKHDSYFLKFVGSATCSVTYNRIAIVNNRKRWKYTGVLHEYIEALDPVKDTGVIQGKYAIVSGRTGNRSQNPNKYLDDAKMLEHALTVESDKGLRNRYLFYLAQSYKDAGLHEKAIEAYTRRGAIFDHSWFQENYISLLYAGRLVYNTGNQAEAVRLWIKAKKVDPSRKEAYYEIIKHYRLADDLTAAYAHRIPDSITCNGAGPRGLFIDRSIHGYLYDYEMSIVAFYSNKDDSLRATQNFMAACASNPDSVPLHLRLSVIKNVRFLVPYISSDNFNKAHFMSMWQQSCPSVLSCTVCMDTLGQVTTKCDQLRQHGKNKSKVAGKRR